MISLELASLEDTQSLAKRLAHSLRAGDTVLLSGELGAGKTTLAQYLIIALSEGMVEVTSPTFTLVQDYPVHLADGSACMLHHYDLYRIENPSALAELGLDEAEEGIRLIEWPQRLPTNFNPASWVSVHFTLTEGMRIASLRSGGSLSTRIDL